MGETATSGALSETFKIRDCAAVSVATGLRAQNLAEFRDGLERAPIQSLFHHFWGHFLRPQFDEREFSNDFAAWARHALHEKSLAEKLSAVNPVEFPDLDELRERLLEIVDERLDSADTVPTARADSRFHFICSELIVFDSDRQLADPHELPTAIETLPSGSIYYHFIDARRRTPDGRDDFSIWLDAFGDTFASVGSAIVRVDPFFFALAELQKYLAVAVRTALEELA